MRLNSPAGHGLGLLLIGCVAGGLAVRYSTTRPRDAVVAAVDSAAVVSDALEVRRGDLSRVLVDQADTVHRRVTLLDSVWATIPVQPETPAETALAIAQLPVLHRATDDAIRACSAYQVTCSEYRRVTDSLVASLRWQRDTLRHAFNQPPPRLSGSLEVGYDVLGQAPSVSIPISLRVVGRWAVTARFDERFAIGEKPRATVFLSHPLF
jgi:hypothetical protein